MASVKVFGSPTSEDVARVLTCLFEKEVKFQLIRTESYTGQERMPDYLKLQPTGKSLAFQDGKITLVDSRVACKHIAEKYADQGNKDLIGRGALERALIEQWLKTEEQNFDPLSSELLFNLALVPLGGQEADIARVAMEQKKRSLAQVLDIYEKRLVETKYLAGDNFTLADLTHLPNTYRLMAFTDFNELFKSRKRIHEWWEAISSRPSWKKVVKMQKELTPPA